ncbi:MAG: AMP-binding protein [bacterium]|nr:AMP-binding protein [bacterium]
MVKSFYKTAQETMSHRDLRALQLEKLRLSVKFAAERSPLYKTKRLPIDFASFDDFSKNIPFTTKRELLECGIWGNLCVPKENIAEVHCSSGTSNKPVYSFLTQKDIREGSEYLARTWYMQGIREESIFTMFASYGLFSAGLLNHYALRHIGAFVIPIGNASALKALEVISEFGSDTCAAVASYYPYFIAATERSGANLKNLGLKHLIAGGEPFSEKQRQCVEKAFGANLYDQYGLCEINTGLAGECIEKSGLHILADYAYPEIIDLETGEVLEDDKEGELVLTTFHKEASPLIRYRTGDITSISHAICACGRTMPRIARTQRRVTDTLFYKGLKIEKPYMADLLEELSAYLNPYIWQMEVRTVAGRDELLLKITPNNSSKEAMDHISDHVQKKLSFNLTLAAFDQEELARLGHGKLKNFIDHRKDQIQDP